MRVEAAELTGERLRRGRADVADAEPDQQLRQRRVRDWSIASTSSCAERSPMRSSGTSRSTVSVVDVGGVVEEAGLHELA